MYLNLHVCAYVYECDCTCQMKGLTKQQLIGCNIPHSLFGGRFVGFTQLTHIAVLIMVGFTCQILQNLVYGRKPSKGVKSDIPIYPAI